MQSRLYVVRDLVAAESGPIFESRNDGIALRNTRLMLSKISPDMHNEFKLLCLGDIDHDTDVITVYGSPRDVNTLDGDGLLKGVTDESI